MITGFFLVVLTFTLHFVVAEPLKYALLGHVVSLTPEMKTFSLEMDILWKHNGDKVVEFNGQEQHVFNRYGGRVTLDWHTAELEIADLRYEDSGYYELEVFMSRKMHRFSFELKVIAKVSKPTISCEMKEGTNSDQSGKQATLMCSAESRQSESLMKFEWSSRGTKRPGQNLTISLGDQHDDEEYSCSVTNPLSNNTTTFTARDCYPETNSAGTVVGIVFAVIAVLVLVGSGLWFWKLRQRRERGSEEKRSNPEEEGLILQQQADLAKQNEDINSGSEEKRSNPEEEGLMKPNQSTNSETRDNPRKGSSIHRQPTTPSPPPQAGIRPQTDTEESDKDCPIESNTETHNDNQMSSGPGQLGDVRYSPSVPPSSPSASSEGGVDKHEKDADSKQIGEEFPQNTTESDMKNVNESDSGKEQEAFPGPEPTKTTTDNQNPEPTENLASEGSDHDNNTTPQSGDPEGSERENSTPDVKAKTLQHLQIPRLQQSLIQVRNRHPGSSGSSSSSESEMSSENEGENDKPKVDDPDVDALTSNVGKMAIKQLCHTLERKTEEPTQECDENGTAV